MNKPLAGVRILDLTHMLSGPYAGMILGDMGAEMIKVEPATGEMTRGLLASDPVHSIDGMGAYFITLNRNKKSVCIDLKSQAGLEVFYDLVRKSDAVIYNFGADVPKRLGIDFDSLKVVNPAIVTCLISGFGSEGPNYRRPAFDQVAQAIGGGMSITGADGEHPMRAGIPIGDLGGGMFAVMGILAALREAGVTGQGQHVDISMLDCQISMLNYMATMYFMSGEDPEPIGNDHFVHVPYNSFKTADGHMVVACVSDKFWHSMKELVQCPDLDKPEYDFQPGRHAAKAEINSRLQEIFLTQPTKHWLAGMTEKRIPCAPVNRFSEALADDQVLHRNMVVDLQHANGKSTKGPGTPIKFSRTNEESFAAAPLLGEHTDEVLAQLLDYSTDHIEALKTGGAVTNHE